MPLDSNIRLELPQTPQTTNTELFNELLPIYEALRKLLQGIETLSLTPGEPGPPGPPGSGSGDAEFVPFFLAEDESFFLPENKQATYAVLIVADGLLEIDGILVEVD